MVCSAVDRENELLSGEAGLDRSVQGELS